MKNNIKKILKNLSNEDQKNRQEHILNILLNSIITLIGVGTLIIFYRLFLLNIENYKHNSLSMFIILSILGLFLFLRFISYKGYSKVSSHILIFILFTLATYMGCKWGIDLPAEVLFYVLVIVTSGILIGSKLSIISTITVSLTMFVIGDMQNRNLIPVDRSWINEPWGYSDVIVTSIILSIIAIVLWLFNRELKKSETELKNERDLLEIRIEEKTNELRIIQAKEIAQVYRFAEFSKLSSGLFHDLVNPLTALMLNINKVKLDSKDYPNFNLIQLEIDQAIKASEKMKDFIVSVRKQINFQNQKESFSLNNEIEESITILNYKARKEMIDIIFDANENIIIHGDPIKFNQIITNLLSNAIDAYDNTPKNKEIIIKLNKLDNQIELEVIDNAKGIEINNLKNIFEPFFTTKNNSDGLGLGLSLVKKIVEESFNGTITVSSKINHGTSFIIKFSLQ